MDEKALRAFLAERFGSAALVEAMRPGEWSAAYSVRAGDRELVARFSAYDEDFEKDAYAARWRSPALPIPPILEWGPAGDGYYAVAERMPGEHIDRLDEQRMRAVLPSLFAVLDALRAVDLSAWSGYGGWRADGRTQYRSWAERLLGIATEPATRGAPGTAREMLGTWPDAARAFDAGSARMARLIEHCPEQRHLIHDDLINYNVLVEGDRISAVLDWGSSSFGDFLYDVAKLVFYRPWYPAWRNIDFAAEARAHFARAGIAVPDLDERLLCYALHIGIGGIGYNAFRRRPQRVADDAARVMALLEAA